jgi:phage shock protein A
MPNRRTPRPRRNRRASAKTPKKRRILEQELTDETSQLAQAKEQLAAQEAIRNGNERNYQRFLERVQPYRDAVATHERNLEALKREIANLN